MWGAVAVLNFVPTFLNRGANDFIETTLKKVSLGTRFLPAPFNGIWIELAPRTGTLANLSKSRNAICHMQVVPSPFLFKDPKLLLSLFP